MRRLQEEAGLYEASAWTTWPASRSVVRHAVSYAVSGGGRTCQTDAGGEDSAAATPSSVPSPRRRRTGPTERRKAAAMLDRLWSVPLRTLTSA